MKGKFFFMTGVFVFATAATGSAALDYLCSADGMNWHVRPVAQTSFSGTVLAPDAMQSMHVISGIDANGEWHRYANTVNEGRIAGSGNFPGGLTCAGPFVSVFGLNVVNNYVATGEEGGLYRLFFHNKQWHSALIHPQATAKYFAVASHRKGPDFRAVAARAGALDRISLSGRTFMLNEAATDYTYCKLDSLNCKEEYYIGLTDQGNINGIKWQGGVRVCPDIRAEGFSGKYVDIAADPANGANWEFLGVRETGVIDRFASAVADAGERFDAVAIGNEHSFYRAVTGDPDNSNVYYALKDGGIDRIYHDGGWQCRQITDGDYDVLGMDFSKAEGTFAVYAATGADTTGFSGSRVCFLEEASVIYSGSGGKAEARLRQSGRSLMIDCAETRMFEAVECRLGDLARKKCVLSGLQFEGDRVRPALILDATLIEKDLATGSAGCLVGYFVNRNGKPGFKVDSGKTWTLQLPPAGWQVRTLKPSAGHLKKGDRVRVTFQPKDNGAELLYLIVESDGNLS